MEGTWIRYSTQIFVQSLIKLWNSFSQIVRADLAARGIFLLAVKIVLQAIY